MPDESPARTPAPTRVLYMRCTENRVEDDYDGGLVLFQGIQGQRTDEFIDARLVLSARTDATMDDYPTTREQKQDTFYRVTLEEIPASEVPPDPAAASTIENHLAQARAAALAAGDHERVRQIDALRAATPATPPSQPAPADQPPPASL